MKEDARIGKYSTFTSGVPLIGTFAKRCAK
jgi:hypothetical protein